MKISPHAKRVKARQRNLIKAVRNLIAQMTIEELPPVRAKLYLDVLYLDVLIDLQKESTELYSTILTAAAVDEADEEDA